MNGNKDCQDCMHADKCVMEFWKENRAEDDCFGASKYVNWLLKNEKNIGIINTDAVTLY